MTSADTDTTRAHWDEVYSHRAVDQVSWFESVPTQSLAWIAETGLATSASIIDVGGGASTLVDELIARGYTDVTVLDISREVLARVEKRLGEHKHVEILMSDITRFPATRNYDLWHDRAVLHFLIDESEQLKYRQALLGATRSGSHIIISTFGPDGPTRCSGLDTVRYDAAKLAAVLGTTFELRRSSVDFHTTPAGVRQQFLHAHFIRR
jgi:SAM-dependent methyltransferase